jgi:hypothetical protein
MAAAFGFMEKSKESGERLNFTERREFTASQG